MSAAWTAAGVLPGLLLECCLLLPAAAGCLAVWLTSLHCFLSVLPQMAATLNSSVPVQLLQLVPDSALSNFWLEHSALAQEGSLSEIRKKTLSVNLLQFSVPVNKSLVLLYIALALTAHFYIHLLEYFTTKSIPSNF